MQLGSFSWFSLCALPANRIISVAAKRARRSRLRQRIRLYLIDPTAETFGHARVSLQRSRCIAGNRTTEQGGGGMIIREFDVGPCTMRKRDPAWRFALAASPVTDGHVLRIATEDGVEGFGYASATPHMGAIAGTLQAELDLFRPLVLGRDARGLEAIMGALDRGIRGAPQAKAAIDCALHDL